MKVKIDPSRCVGCGICAETLPLLFVMGPFHARVRYSTLTPPEELLVAQIAEDCPSGALRFEEEEVPSLAGRSAGNGYDEPDHDEQVG